MLTLEKTLCNFGCIWEALFFKNNLRRNNFKKNYQNAIVNLEKCKQYSILPHPLGWAGKTKVSKFFLFVFDFFFFFFPKERYSRWKMQSHALLQRGWAQVFHFSLWWENRTKIIFSLLQEDCLFLFFCHCKPERLTCFLWEFFIWEF